MSRHVFGFVLPCVPYQWDIWSLPIRSFAWKQKSEEHGCDSLLDSESRQSNVEGRRAVGIYLASTTAFSIFKSASQISSTLTLWKSFLFMTPSPFSEDVPALWWYRWCRVALFAIGISIGGGGGGGGGSAAPSVAAAAAAVPVVVVVVIIIIVVVVVFLFLLLLLLFLLLLLLMLL